MPVPKRKVSKARKRARKANWLRAPLPGLSNCPNCGEAARPHCVCPNCGHYKGREVVKSER